jgi:hypothetical protein
MKLGTKKAPIPVPALWPEHMRPAVMSAYSGYAVQTLRNMVSARKIAFSKDNNGAVTIAKDDMDAFKRKHRTPAIGEESE